MQTRTILCLLIVIGLCWQTGCQSPQQAVNDFSPFAGKSVQDFLESYTLNLSNAAFYDEPPGKLRQLKFRDQPKFGGRTISLQLAYTAELFSSTRAWDQALVRRAIIESVSETKNR